MPRRAARGGPPDHRSGEPCPSRLPARRRNRPNLRPPAGRSAERGARPVRTRHRTVRPEKSLEHRWFARLPEGPAGEEAEEAGRDAADGGVHGLSRRTAGGDPGDLRGAAAGGAELLRRHASARRLARHQLAFRRGHRLLDPGGRAGAQFGRCAVQSRLGAGQLRALRGGARRAGAIARAAAERAGHVAESGDRPAAAETGRGRPRRRDPRPPAQA